MAGPSLFRMDGQHRGSASMWLGLSQRRPEWLAHLVFKETSNGRGADQEPTQGQLIEQARAGRKQWLLTRHGFANGGVFRPDSSSAELPGESRCVAEVEVGQPGLGRCGTPRTDLAAST